MVGDRDGRPKRTPGTATVCVCVCVAGVHCCEITLGCRSMECDLLSALSICPRIFLRVFFGISSVIGDTFYVVVFYTVCSCVQIVLV